MCETHINQLIRENFPVKKVSSSHHKGTAEILAENALEENSLRKALDSIGYTLTHMETEPYQKKRFLFF